MDADKFNAAVFAYLANNLQIVLVDTSTGTMFGGDIASQSKIRAELHLRDPKTLDDVVISTSEISVG